MTRNASITFLRTLALTAFLMAAPCTMMAMEEPDDVETEMQAVALTVSGTHVNVSGADGLVMEVYNLTGIKVATFRIDSDSKQLSLAGLPGGYYILKVGTTVRKVSIK